MRKAFTTYILILGIWLNSLECRLKYLIDALDCVQRGLTKRISSLAHFSYLEWLAMALNLEPLDARRLQFDLIQHNRIPHNLSCIPSSQHFVLHQAGRCLRNSTTAPVINKPLASNNLCISFHCGIDCWNSLPQVLLNLHRLTPFETPSLKQTWTVFLKVVHFNVVFI